MRRLVKYMCGQKKQQQYDIHQSEPNLDVSTELCLMD